MAYSVLPNGFLAPIRVPEIFPNEDLDLETLTLSFLSEVIPYVYVSLNVENDHVCVNFAIECDSPTAAQYDDAFYEQFTI